MSRIGNKIISIPKGVSVSVSGRTIAVKGPKGNLTFDVPARIEFAVEGSEIKFSRDDDSPAIRSLHGTARARTANLVEGCSVGFKRTLEIVGVGYRATVKGKNVDLALGFSHPISYPLPEGISAVVDKAGLLHLSGADKIVLGQVAADIRAYRPPEPYKGKGVRYSDETIIRKEGKARAKG